jgi:hypothetical protein
MATVTFVTAFQTGGENQDGQRYPRLQGRLQDQLAFVNNLLITLAVAVLAFAANAAVDRSELHNLGWRRWLLGAALVLLALSLVLGIGLAVSRLQSFRLTAQIGRISDLRDEIFPPGSPERSVGRSRHDRLGGRSKFLVLWSNFGVPPDLPPEQGQPGITFPAQPDGPFPTLRRGILRQLSTLGRQPDRHTVQQPALAVWLALASKKTETTASQPATGTVVAGKPADAATGPLDPLAEPVRDLLEALRGWTATADRVTWRLLWWQAAVFLLAALALLLVPLTLYF